MRMPCDTAADKAVAALDAVLEKAKEAEAQPVGGKKNKAA